MSYQNNKGKDEKRTQIAIEQQIKLTTKKKLKK
jgi:hypothetical protein